MALKLFTYVDPVGGHLPDPHETDIDNPLDADKDLLKLLGKYCPIDTAKNILIEVRDHDVVWLGVGKRSDEVAQRWEEGHPWLPEIITIPGDRDNKPKNLVAADAAPITRDTLYNEVTKLTEVCRLSLDTILESITVIPAWQHPAVTKKDIGADEKIFADNADFFAYELHSVASSTWRHLVNTMVAQFLYVLPDLHEKHPSDLHLESVDLVDCKPHPVFKCDGLCGAWYIVELQYSVLGPNGQKAQKHHKIRIPVGLLLNTSPSGRNSNPTLTKVSFDAVNANVYTAGLAFRFICEKDEKIYGERSYTLQLLSHWTFLKGRLIARNVQDCAYSNLMAPLEKFKVHKCRAQWQGEQEPRAKAILAENIIPDVIGEQPLAIFTETGVHLLQTREQIGAVCARNNLLEKLFYAPPWPSKAKWLNEPLSRVWSGHQWSDPHYDEMDLEGYWPGGREALEDDVDGVRKVQESLQQTISILRSKDLGIDEYGEELKNIENKKNWDKKFRETTIRMFRDMLPQQQLQLISELWSLLTTSYNFNKFPREMFDPDYDIPSDDKCPLPTSWCPDPSRPGQYIKGSNIKQPWRTLGVGFRVEGTWEDKDRTLARYQEKNGQGMTQQRLNREYMREKRQLDFTGTILDDPKRFFLWNCNVDTFNETAICVSRNLFGAAAFPERDSNGEYTLFALDCYDLKGVDTESEQLKKGAQWRPGEKAFEQIHYENIIGWVRIHRQGGNKNEGIWKFEIISSDCWEINTAWKAKHAELYVSLRENYIKTQLNAWHGYQHEIDGKCDFAKKR